MSQQLANTSGTNPKPNELQNTQTQTGNFDASHIICNSDGTIDVKGILNFTPPLPISISDKIQSPLINSLIQCFDNTFIDILGKVTGIQYGASAVQTSEDGNTTLAVWNNNIILNSSQSILLNSSLDLSLTMQFFNINSIPSSEYDFSYGQSNSPFGTAQNNYNFQFTSPLQDAGISDPDITIQCMSFPDFNQWFGVNTYNPPNNNIINIDGDAFKFVITSGKMIQIEFKFLTNYQFDGFSYPASYLMCGLFCRETNSVLPQSVNWIDVNDIKFKYVAFQSTFTMQSDSNSYVPFFQQHNNGQLQSTDVSGQMASYIKIKQYQFISY